MQEQGELVQGSGKIRIPESHYVGTAFECQEYASAYRFALDRIGFETKELESLRSLRHQGSYHRNRSIRAPVIHKKKARVGRLLCKGPEGIAWQAAPLVIAGDDYGGGHTDVPFTRSLFSGNMISRGIASVFAKTGYHVEPAKRSFSVAIHFVGPRAAPTDDPRESGDVMGFTLNTSLM